MSNELAPTVPHELEVREEYLRVVTEERIVAWRAQFESLAITDVNDRAQLAAVHEARMTVKEARVSIEKARKRLKEGALAYGRFVDGEAKRFTALIEPIEERLWNEEQKVAAEKARLEAIAEQARIARHQERMHSLAEVRSPLASAEVERMDDEAFQRALDKAAMDWTEKLFQAAKEAEERSAETARLEAQRTALAKREAELQAAEAQLKADQKAAADGIAAAKKAAADAIAVEQERVRLELWNQEQLEKRLADEEQERADRLAAKRLGEERATDTPAILAFADQLDQLQVPFVWCKGEIDEILLETSGMIRALTGTPDDEEPDDAQSSF